LDNKILLIAALALFAVAAAFVVFAPKLGDRDAQVPQTATAPSQIDAIASAALVSAEDDSQTTLATGANEADESQTASEVASGSTTPTHRVVASYFHNTTRCVTCRTIEQRSKETMESTFAAEMAAGKLAWRSLNMEERQHEHYAIDYSLTSPSLVLTEMDGDRDVHFKVLTETWTLVHTKVQFVTYIETEVRAFLEEL
jgi:hypothetical protein